VTDLPNLKEKVFKTVPNCIEIQYYLPPTNEEINNFPSMREFTYILEKLPSMIKKNLPVNQLHKIHEQHCLDKPNEQHRSLVLIDGGRFEFYIRDEEDDSPIFPLMFDVYVMQFFLSTWSGKKFQFIKTPRDFRMMLKKYISRCYDESYNIHAISFILDYPNSNEVRQWSHIDGFSNTFQGSLSCGNGTSVTMEFPVLQPNISTITDLQKVWTFLPERNNIFSAISQNNDCIDLLNQYGKLLNHDPETPLNPISYQRALARFCENFRGRNSPFPAGTIFQMAGNTIHAGPESDKQLCRCIFFYAASPPGMPLYDPNTQWNQVTLTAAILELIWEKISKFERGYLLEYIRHIQINSKIAPSDTSIFIGNYTLRLFVRVILFVKQISKSYPSRQQKYINFLEKVCSVANIQKRKQFITKKMINELDPNLLKIIFKHESKEASKETFLL
jgi:hypothetical protein